MTDHALSALEEVLTAQLRITQSIADLTERERLALQSNDLAALVEVVHNRTAHLAELGRLEADRQAATAAWSQAIQPDATDGDLSFDRLLAHSDGETARKLRTLRDGITAYLERARSLSAGNRALVQVALDRNEALRSFLVRLASGGEGYGLAETGRLAHPANHLMDWSG